MTQRDRTFATTSTLVFAAFAACTTPNPNYRKPHSDGGLMDDSGGGVTGSCESGAALRCDGTNLIRCNTDGTGEVSEACSLGCSSTEYRCAEMVPSNGLAKFLSLASGEPDLDLGDWATINTDTGEVKVADKVVLVTSVTVPQAGAPTIRALAVHSLIANAVTVTGNNALAIVSSGDIMIKGVFAVSAKMDVPAAGASQDDSCRGKNAPPPNHTTNQDSYGGAGGGGFGSPGGAGGTARAGTVFSAGGDGGFVSGNDVLVPLRGGCNGGVLGGHFGGGGGGAQLASRTRILVSGTIAANGAAGGGGGSGGGLLLEAPTIEILGHVVANGGGAFAHGVVGIFAGEDGSLDDKPAKGGVPVPANAWMGAGGNGAAGNAGATNGESIATDDSLATGGGGGGGAGRIRVNTAPNGLHITSAGLFSPSASIGNLAFR